MAILFSDGCDSYAATSDLTKKWPVAQSPWVWSSSAGRNGGGALQAATTGGGIIRAISSGFSTNTVTCYGFWVKISAAPAAVGTLLNTRKSDASAMFQLRVATSGKLTIANSGGAASFTGSVNVCDNNWHWVEAQIANTNLSNNKCWIDTVAEWNSVIGGQAATATDSFEFNSITGVTVTIDDVIAYDDSSGAPLTSAIPLGPRQITTVRPQADGVVGFLTATGGSTHYNQVNEVNADGDTTYVESAVSGDQDLYDFAAMGISPATITSVVANAYVSNPNPGVINMKQIVKSVSTQTDGTSVQTPSSYLTKQQSFPLDPNTAAAWASASAIDASTFGVKVV